MPSFYSFYMLFILRSSISFYGLLCNTKTQTFGTVMRCLLVKLIAGLRLCPRCRVITQDMLQASTGYEPHALTLHHILEPSWSLASNPQWSFWCFTLSLGFSGPFWPYLTQYLVNLWAVYCIQHIGTLSPSPPIFIMIQQDLSLLHSIHCHLDSHNIDPSSYFHYRVPSAVPILLKLGRESDAICTYHMTFISSK